MLLLRRFFLRFYMSLRYFYWQQAWNRFVLACCQSGLGFISRIIARLPRLCSSSHPTLLLFFSRLTPACCISNQTWPKFFIYLFIFLQFWAMVHIRLCLRMSWNEIPHRRIYVAAMSAKRKDCGLYMLSVALWIKYSGIQYTDTQCVCYDRS